MGRSSLHPALSPPARKGGGRASTSTPSCKKTQIWISPGLLWASPKNSPGLRPFGVSDHLLVVGFLIPRRECRDPPGDLTVVPLFFGFFFEPLALHGSIFLFCWSPWNINAKRNCRTAMAANPRLTQPTLHKHASRA